MADNMSFLPEDYLEKKIARRTNLIFISLFAVVLGTVVAADFVGRRQETAQIAELADRNKKFEEIHQQFEQLKKLKAKESEMKRKANVTASLKDRVPKSAVFNELINNMPPTLRLTDLDLETKKAKSGAKKPRTSIDREKLRKEGTGQTGAKVVPTVVNIDLVGLAPTDVDISEYIGTLNGHPMFDDVALAFVEEFKDNTEVLRKFRIELSLTRDFDATAFTPTRAGRTLEVDPVGDVLQISPEGELVKPTETLGSVPTE